MNDLAPLYGLRIRTPRIELRLGSHGELRELGRLAERGIHPPEEMPFEIPWTDRTGEPDFVDRCVAFHEDHLTDWSPASWVLNLLVWQGRRLVGTQGMLAERFAERRIVHTGSWLGRAYQRHGVGTEMRAAVLELAFRGLDAARAESTWFDGNDASRRVSEKLGYIEHGISTKSPRGTPVVEHEMTVAHAEWRCPLPVEIAGLEPCLPLFGLSSEP